MYIWFILMWFSVCYGLPLDIIVHNVAESHNFDDIDNYIPKYDDIPKHIPSINHAKNEIPSITTPEDIPLFDINDYKDETSTLTAGNIDFNKTDKVFDDILNANTINNDNESINNDNSTINSSASVSTTISSTTAIRTSEISSTLSSIVTSQTIDLIHSAESTNASDVTVRPDSSVIGGGFNISEVENPINDTTRNPREEADKDDPEFADKENESEEDSDEEEDMNMITGLLSALLGGLSKPDGSIDLDAIVGLIGSLSTQNDDGTYDFQGLTDLLKGFFGGGTGGGGSDIGAFTGGLLGAVIKGIANPPGGKGVGILTAKILGGILPALSVQPPDETMQNGKPSFVKPGGLDIGGFLGGFIKTFLEASKGVNPVKVVISTITSLSNSKPKGGH